MIYPIAFVLGAIFGWTRAGRRGGDRLDRFQYAAVHGILFALLALAFVILVGHLGFWA